VTFFRKIDDKDVGTTPILISVMEADDGVLVGRVLAHNDQLFSTAPFDPPIEEAISIAALLATTNNVPVSVYDPHNRWRASWGELH
jgi:hypothetical protein